MTRCRVWPSRPSVSTSDTSMPPRGHCRPIVSAAGWLVLGVLAVFPGCRPPAEEEHEWPPVSVRTEVVQKRTLRPSFIVIGTVMADPQRHATLSASAAGLADRLVAREGRQGT